MGDKTNQNYLCPEPRIWRVSSYTFTINLAFVGILSNTSLEGSLDLMYLDYDSSLESLHA